MLLSLVPVAIFVAAFVRCDFVTPIISSLDRVSSLAWFAISSSDRRVVVRLKWRWTMPFVGRTLREVIFLLDQSADESVLLKTVSALVRVTQVARESRLEPNLSKVPWSAQDRMDPLSFFLFVVISRIMK